ncbi:MAG TPA: indolepyruvate ferredoxin oxidoreductase family protein [Caulobacteraceae bacterium]|jgi:indolepyruvate ferredoxin oxidoreductase|nr:indolepyruvate ferredoxin oxidoreductase family protein [Caulobacteraceae bacterium]
MAALDLQFSFDDIYSRETGPLYMSGIQALVRLPLMQRRLDRARGLNTAGLISGYRGSPLGAYDLQLWRAGKILEAHDIVFQPGLNEDLAATALWGAQMHKAFGQTRADGVFGVWYGKGPGVDRSGDAFRHANVMGTSALGGVLALAGDDHSAQSSIFPHQSDGIFHSVMMPILQPASVSEILRLGLAGFALSRFSGLWVAIKTIAEVAESAASFPAPAPLPRFVAPADFVVPAHGLNWDPTIAWPAARAELERRLVEERIPAALAWVRANGIEGVVQDAPRRRILLVTTGKAHQDLMEALAGLGISPARAADLGLCIYKVAMSWPLETSRLKILAGEVETVVVLEEKRGYVEDQLKAALFDLPAGHRPKVLGKRDETGARLTPEVMEFSPLIVARALVQALGEAGQPFQDVLERWAAKGAAPDRRGLTDRSPFFCAGCPHNTSTRTPDGSIAGGGIGCHIMALAEPALKTSTYSHMGAEGLQWVGASPFVETPHFFQNMGDGTYQHSGVLAVRAALAANANITFKILYNDAVAMTGGQTAEGHLDPLKVTRELAAEGVSTIALVSDDPDKWRGAEGLGAGVEVVHRDELDALQRRLREIPGVTAIVYEQTCASEKRRRRKRGAFPDPDKRLLINPRVCEGCGDCQVQSNCIAIDPLPTEFGVKRRINQSACNKDFSCVKGFCPSFVEVEGARLPKPDAAALARDARPLFDALPNPRIPALTGGFNIYVAGVGGSGVLTMGALLGTAAHMEGIEASTLDFTGLAQKNGAVSSQIRLAPSGEAINAVRIGPGGVDLLLAADLVVAASAESLTRLDKARARIALNLDTPPTAEAVTRHETVLPLAAMTRAVSARARDVETVHATRLAEAIFGDATCANTLLLGFAWQKGWIPISEPALLRAIEINGVAVETNRQAFAWGRVAGHDLAGAERAAGVRPPPPADESLDQRIERLAADLTAYQDRRYADRYRALTGLAAAADAKAGGDGGFAMTVARQAHRLMAYKDEYEVARLYAEPGFAESLGREFQSHGRLSVWLAPPMLSRIDPATGRPKKRKFGPWVFTAFKWLAKGKALRGSGLDPFGHSAERRQERALIETYEADIRAACGRLEAGRYAEAAALAAWPAEVRGFGPVKAEAAGRALALRAQLLAAFEAPPPLAIAAE